MMRLGGGERIKRGGAPSLSAARHDKRVTYWTIDIHLHSSSVTIRGGGTRPAHTRDRTFNPKRVSSARSVPLARYFVRAQKRSTLWCAKWSQPAATLQPIARSRSTHLRDAASVT